LGPAAAIALLLPASFSLAPETAIILLAGVYYGSMYGGTITSVLLNVPGESSSVVTCLDGYQMARQGRAGPALGIAAFGSFIAGTLARLSFRSLPLLGRNRPPLWTPGAFRLDVPGHDDPDPVRQRLHSEGLAMAAAGIIIGSIGMDIVSGRARFTFGIHELMDGIGWSR